MYCFKKINTNKYNVYLILLINSDVAPVFTSFNSINLHI